jgi:hypothetical protein
MIAYVTDVHSVRQVCTILNSTTAEPVDAAIDTLVIYSDSQGMYFTVTRSAFGTWGQTDSLSYHGDVGAIPTRLYLTPEGKASAIGGAGRGGGGSGGGTAGGDDGSHGAGPPAARAMTPYDALAAYKQDYPKAKMSDTAILDYIAAILSMSDAKKAVGKALPKLETIQQACALAGLMSRNVVGQPTPFYQRGGRRTIHTQALDAIFHWVTGLPAKKKHSHSDSTDEGREAAAAGGGGDSSDAAGAGGAAKPSKVGAWRRRCLDCTRASASHLQGGRLVCLDVLYCCSA